MAEGAVNINHIENVYCPICEERYGRKKLLFQKDDKTSGTIIIRCRGCKEDVKLALVKANESIKDGINQLPETVRKIPNAVQNISRAIEPRVK